MIPDPSVPENLPILSSEMDAGNSTQCIIEKPVLVACEEGSGPRPQGACHPVKAKCRNTYVLSAKQCQVRKAPKSNR